MSGDSVPGGALLKPHYHISTDLFLWHQYQGDNTNDCAAFSIAIVGNALANSLRFDGYKVAREMEKVTLASAPVPHLSLWKIPRWATLPWGISGYLQSKNIPAKLHWFASAGHLLRNIQENRFTIVIIGDLRKGWGHAKVLYGYEPPAPATPGPGADDQLEQGYYFVDPGYPKEWSRPHHARGVFWQDENEFKPQWNSLFRILIEIKG
jgi:hypothetical protein